MRLFFFFYSVHDFSELLHSNGQLKVDLAKYPELYQLLVNTGTCAVCSHPVINSWLECVHFQNAKTVSRFLLHIGEGLIFMPPDAEVVED